MDERSRDDKIDQSEVETEYSDKQAKHACGAEEGSNKKDNGNKQCSRDYRRETACHAGQEANGCCR
jgi:hypothetical protein